MLIKYFICYVYWGSYIRFWLKMEKYGSIAKKCKNLKEREREREINPEPVYLRMKLN